MIGDISRFSSRLQERIRRSEALTENNDGLTLNIAANYGGRWDIIQGVRSWPNGYGWESCTRIRSARNY